MAEWIFVQVARVFIGVLVMLAVVSPMGMAFIVLDDTTPTKWVRRFAIAVFVGWPMVSAYIIGRHLISQ